MSKIEKITVVWDLKYLASRRHCNTKPTFFS